MQQEPIDLYGALCTVQRLLEDRDEDLLTDRWHTLNYLADLIPEDQTSRSRMRMFYDSGAAAVLRKKSRLPADQLCRRAADVYMKYTESREDVAMEVVGAVIRALGMELSEQQPAQAGPSGRAELPDVRKSLGDLRAAAMLRDGTTGEDRQRRSREIEEIMGELLCTLMDSKLVEEQEQLWARLDDASEQEKETIRARIRQIYRLEAEYSVNINLAANVDADPEDADMMAERQDPLNRASLELGSLFLRQRKGPRWERRQLAEQIEKKLDEIMALQEGHEEEPAPQPQRSVPGTIVPAMCSRVRLAGPGAVLERTIRDQGLWDSWTEGRQILDGTLQDVTYGTIERMLSVFEKGAQTDPDCMQHLADLYYAGIDMDMGRFHAEGMLLPRSREKSQYWEKKAAAAGHSIALFNQGLEALLAGDLDRAEQLGQRSVQAKVGEHISDGHYLLALVEMVRWKQHLDAAGNALGGGDGSDAGDMYYGHMQYQKIENELTAALAKGRGSRENRLNMLNCSSGLRSTYGKQYNFGK